MNLVHDYLRKNGPSSSSEIKTHLIQVTKVSDDTARKQISRFRGAKRIQGNFLPKGEVILFLEEHKNGVIYWNRLSQIVRQSKTASGKAYRAFELRGGAIESSRFHVVGCAPTMPRSKVVGSVTALSSLLSIGLLKETEVDSQKVLHVNGLEWNQKHRARGAAEAIAINLLKRYVTNLNMSSFRATTIRGDAKSSQIFSYHWDLAGPSYLSAFTSWTGEKILPGLLVADLILASNVNYDSLSAFISKVDAVQQISKVPVLIMLVCESFEPTTFKKLRDKGIIPATTNNLFGKDAADLLRNIESVFMNAGAALVKNSDEVFSLFEKLRDFETDLKPIRGYLFEYIIANLLYKEGHSIDVSQLITAPTGDMAEIDVKAVKGQLIISSECKGLAPGTLLNEDDVKDWIERQVPRIYAWFIRGMHTKYINQNEIEFHLYFSGTIDQELRAYCENRSEETKKYKIKFFDYHEIIPRLKAAGCESALNRLNQFYTSS